MDKERVDALIGAMVGSAERVSDLLFITGKPPLVQTDGRLHSFPIDAPGGTLTAEVIAGIADCAIDGNSRLLQAYDVAGSCDMSYEVSGVGRFRVNVYRQNSGRAVIMRKFPEEIPTLTGLGLPRVFLNIVKEKNGLVLVTGATGSGKTTTLAAMLNHLNQTEPIHILTLEDPVEFIYPAGLGAVSQRELGRDFESFAAGLRVALRQAPKAILLGEIRDRETMEIALTASETGHIVFATMHTINTGQTINRILGFFSLEEEQQIRCRLAATLRYVVSQRLIASMTSQPLLITEVIGNGLRTSETIRYGEAEGKTFAEIAEAGSDKGWHTFDQCLLRAYKEGLILDETAALHCDNKGKMRRDLDLIQKGSAKAMDALSGLRLDIPVPPQIVSSLETVTHEASN